MSDCEWFAQNAQDKWATVSNAHVAQDKWATVSKPLRFLRLSHDKWANERFAQKIWLKKSNILFFSMFYNGFLFKKLAIRLIPSFLVSNVSVSLRSLTKNEQCERFAQVAQQKWATMSESLRLLTKNERMSKSLIFSQKNERFAQKTDERIPNPVFNPLYKIQWRITLFIGMTVYRNL